MCTRLSSTDQIKLYINDHLIAQIPRTLILIQYSKLLLSIILVVPGAQWNAVSVVEKANLFLWNLLLSKVAVLSFWSMLSQELHLKFSRTFNDSSKVENQYIWLANVKKSKPIYFLFAFGSDYSLSLFLCFSLSKSQFQEFQTLCPFLQHYCCNVERFPKFVALTTITKLKTFDFFHRFAFKFYIILHSVKTWQQLLQLHFSLLKSNSTQ